MFNEKLGNKIEYGVIVGKSFSGKSTLCKMLAQHQGFTVIDMKDIAEKLRAKLGTEDGPFEGEVPVAEVEKEIVAVIASSKGAATKAKFVFDGYTHKTEEAFLSFTEQFGLPEFLLLLTAEFDTISKRLLSKEEGEELTEDQRETLKEDSATNKARR